MVTILQRFALFTLALLVFAAPAGAAEVARVDGATLDARHERDAGFCLRLTERDSLTGRGSGTCGSAPVRPLRSLVVTMPLDDEVAVGGAVPADVARAEAELADGRRIGFDTVAGDGYRGRHAGRLRFLLAKLPLTDLRDDRAGGLVALRLYGADGGLRGITALAPEGRLVGAPQRLLREGRGRSSISVAAEVRRVLASTPLQLDRFEERTCVTVRTRIPGSGGRSSFCREPGPARPQLAVLPEHGCGRVRSVLWGFVGDGVGAVRLRLGSGRAREVRTRTLRGAGGAELRVVAAPLPRGEAIRSVAAVGAPERYEIGAQPGGLPCVSHNGVLLFGYPPGFGGSGPALAPGSGEQLAAERDGHRLLVRDAESERLCADIDMLLADGTDCLLPPTTADDAFAFGGDGLVSGVLPAEVARVRLANGRELETVEGGYDGRYRGTVRFLLAATHRYDGIRMLDAAGASLGRLPVLSPEAAPPRRGPVRIAGGRGWRLEASRHDGYSCLTLALPGDDEGCETTLRGGTGAFAAVGCRPRVAVVYGVLARETRSVTAQLRGGRRLRARIVPIPRRLGRGRAFVLALPRGARVEAMRFDGRRFTFPLLPAADQCGYRVYEPYLSPPVEFAVAASARAWRGTARPRGWWSGR